ncbi:MAG: hypothetical protein A2X35_09165 [Elusimicrobia bacterium GWA2_61_42]|nr:MAG: hypothetical protein A2X35_09165 [Elusimicrobia bacterium GWA2_61_42]
MIRLSDKLKGYQGANPFSESQAKAYSDEKIVREFFPISLYWSLFNEQHEILIGTRGSGKTVILKMLTYSCLRLSQDPKAEAIKKKKEFIGFYVPLHLEFMAALSANNIAAEKRLEYFQFAINCIAATSFLTELKFLLKDCYNTPMRRLEAEHDIIVRLMEMWFPETDITMSSLGDIEWHIKTLYENQPFWADGSLLKKPPLAHDLLGPIVSVLPKVSEILGLDIDKTTWIACIDEAEFVEEPFIRCINHFLRSRKRPLVLKIATLPFKYSTRETLANGVSVEPGGNDFNYRNVDRPCDSDDFKGLTNHLLKTRLSKCDGIDFGKISLESFLGVIGEDDLQDYFKLEMHETLPDEESIRTDFALHLSDTRKRNLLQMEAVDSPIISQAIFKKFMPIYYMRRMKIEGSKGNRAVGWFAGATVARKIADGNPRLFIQLMNEMVDSARERELTPKNQHRINMEFCQRHLEASEGLPDYGPVLKEILTRAGELLGARIHDGALVDGGCDFRLDRRVVELPLLRKALELGAAYTLIVCDEKTLFNGISSDNVVRLSYPCAIHYWLPLRKGLAVNLKPSIVGELASTKKVSLPISKQTSQEIVKQLQLSLFESL